MKSSLHVLITGLTGVILSVLSLSAAKAQTPDGSGIVYVKTASTGTGTGDSWANATNNLQGAVDATGVAQVWVAAGEYETPATGLKMKNNVAIYGGFPATGTPLMPQRNWVSNLTELTGNNSHRVIYNNFTLAAQLQNTAILDGFSIKNGSCPDASSGAGIYNEEAFPVLRNLNIYDNNAGGNNVDAASDGGGIFNNNASPTLTNVIISNNKASKNGGGIANQNYSSPTLTNVLISGNQAGRNGGGVFIYGNSSPQFVNVTIANNKANNTWRIGSYSTTNGNGGGSYVDNGNSYPSMKNCIIWGNTSDKAGKANIANVSPGIHTFTNSLIQGSGGSGAWVAAYGTDGGNNKAVDPLLDGNFKLTSSSPAADAGDDALFPGAATAKDLAGSARIANARIDMGAYEFQGTLPVALISFTAKTQGNGALLQWQTATESNNKGFMVYRSTDGNNFAKIGERSPAAANSTAISTYTFTDNAPLNGTNYYKLVQQDKDGATTDLGIKSLNFALAKVELQVYPNPTDNVVNISFEAGQFANIELINSNGKVLQSIALNNTDSSKTLTIADYPNGIYIVKLSGKAYTESKKIIKK